MSTTENPAAAALYADDGVVAELASKLIRVERHNLVERPWGGNSMQAYKRIPASVPRGEWPWGEAFEISAFDEDDEASRYPSRVRLGDSETCDLPALLAARADVLLGDRFVRRYGPRFPLLPKTLSVRELLSVQGHPAGNTEVYIIIDAEPGATLRLGFSRDVDAAVTTQQLERGLDLQGELLGFFGPAFDARALQQAAQPWFANRTAPADATRDWLGGQLAPSLVDGAIGLLRELKALYWQVLDSMNAIEVRPGQVIYNATPARLLAGSDRPPSAEVHALGNPEGREILALEIRVPGPTFRAWDNVRFPRRDVDVRAAIDALNLKATTPEDFIREPVAIPGRSGAFVSVDSEFFRVEHLRPAPGGAVTVPASVPHSLHCLEGTVECFNAAGQPIGTLERGESALVPAPVGAYRLEATAPAHVVRAVLPDPE